MKKLVLTLLLIASLCATGRTIAQGAPPAVPAKEELTRPFGAADATDFQNPPLVYHPETWFHYIGGNVSYKGITADLEAISKAGISGIQLFHGQFGGPWPGVAEQIPCLSGKWDAAVRHTAQECKRLGLRFTMQNCPGWAMSGGPWITPENAMRNLVCSTIDVEKGKVGPSGLVLPVPQPSKEEWRDYRDIAVLAFPTPTGNDAARLVPESVRSSHDVLPWLRCLGNGPGAAITLKPAEENKPYWIEASFAKEVTLRTITFPPVQTFSHQFCYEPGVHLTAEAVLGDGTKKTLVEVEMPPGSWQDDQPISFACDETSAKTFRMTLANRHDMKLGYIRLSGSARINNWESEAGWTLRRMVRNGNSPRQSRQCFIPSREIRDITATMDAQGRLTWNIPDGSWTIMRVGHVNAGRRNGPAPPEGTGWECDKLSVKGPDRHFAGYIGRLSGKNGPLDGGLLNGMLLDSWECKTQTWTTGLDKTFLAKNQYALFSYLPAVFGYVVDDHETSKRFLRDWRGTINDLFANAFYGRMAQLARGNGLAIQYETAAGDIFPADILEYYKHADVPMCEFWQPFSDGFVGSLDFKPIKPTASAARIYGKPRVAAEAFTSFELTWDENWETLKEVFNINAVEGVTHCIFHTCTHNPRVGELPPGTSMGSKIGTPFIREQTWWKHLSVFVDYLARCNFMLERGWPVSDVLWYLGDEIDHKPDQTAAFPEGFKYDYCNHDALVSRLSVKDGRLTTPEGIGYRVLWIPESTRMLPETLEKLVQLVQSGAVVVGNRPKGPATLAGGGEMQKRFDRACETLWGRNGGTWKMRTVGAGKVLADMSIGDALKSLKMDADVKALSGSKEPGWLHRRSDGADWYFVCAPKGSDFDGDVAFRCDSTVGELWNPVTGGIEPVNVAKKGKYAVVHLTLYRGGACFVALRGKQDDSTARGVPEWRETEKRELSAPWTLVFPKGYGIDKPVVVERLVPWKDLPVSDEGKAFSGSVKYTTTFEQNEVKDACRYTLDLGRVAMVAAVRVNGKASGTVWCAPYRVDITNAIHKGVNRLEIEATGTWFNRLAYDAGLPESARKTWTIGGPEKGSALRDSGLLGPVVLTVEKNIAR